MLVPFNIVQSKKMEEELFINMSDMYTGELGHGDIKSMSLIPVRELQYKIPKGGSKLNYPDMFKNSVNILLVDESKAEGLYSDWKKYGEETFIMFKKYNPNVLAAAFYIASIRGTNYKIKEDAIPNIIKNVKKPNTTENYVLDFLRINISTAGVNENLFLLARYLRLFTN